jgi:hypothetical protein
MVFDETRKFIKNNQGETRTQTLHMPDISLFPLCFRKSIRKEQPLLLDTSKKEDAGIGGYALGAELSYLI